MVFLKKKKKKKSNSGFELRTSDTWVDDSRTEPMKRWVLWVLVLNKQCSRFFTYVLKVKSSYLLNVVF